MSKQNLGKAPAASTAATIENSATLESDLPESQTPDILVQLRTLQAYLHQCNLHFRLNSSRFKDDAARVAFATSFLQGKALTWWLNIGEYRGYGELETDWEAYKAEIFKQYGDSDRETDAYYKISS